MNWFLYDRDLRHERVKVYNNLAETIFNDLFFKQENKYNFCRNEIFK